MDLFTGLKGYVSCKLSVLSNKTDSFTASLKTSFASFENCLNGNRDILKKKENIVILQNEL